MVHKNICIWGERERVREREREKRERERERALAGCTGVKRKSVPLHM